uniref:DUF2237 domain-containing protein n=1 Tax=Tetradesmus obliquus TaxID=3088 RepID=A0A383W0P9_TETOB|eukprot:jgi/Sobl393_1/16507/SZX70673.1
MLFAARSFAAGSKAGQSVLGNCTAAGAGSGCGQRMSTFTRAADTSNTVQALNVLGTPLQCCCKSPMTGYYRDGFCRTGGGDVGAHVVCAQVTEEFLSYTRAKGNDLSTPAPQYGFPGLKPGDRWCLCASRWKEAADAGKAPPVVLSGCHIRALDYVDMALLKAHAVAEEEQQQ